MLKFTTMILFIGLTSLNVHADSDTLDAAVGGGIGGAIGAAVGNEVGGKDGAMIGGAIGAAAGVGVNVDEEQDHDHNAPRRSYIEDDRHNDHFCPPGQAKKGNC